LFCPAVSESDEALFLLCPRDAASTSQSDQALGNACALEPPVSVTASLAAESSSVKEAAVVAVFVDTASPMAEAAAESG